jgi:hypothetical protein
MKKIITAATFLVFGTMLTMAQTTKKIETKSSTTKTEMKAKSSVHQNKKPKMVDTANIEERQKEADGKLQRQTIPQKDGLNNEAVKPAQTVPTELE